jgi:hypothetical protein
MSSNGDDCDEHMKYGTFLDHIAHQTETRPNYNPLRKRTQFLTTPPPVPTHVLKALTCPSQTSRVLFQLEQELPVTF